MVYGFESIIIQVKFLAIIQWLDDLIIEKQSTWCFTTGGFCICSKT